MRRIWKVVALLVASGGVIFQSGTFAYGAQQLSPVGFGPIAAEAQGQRDYGMIIEGHNHFKQKKDMFDLRRYGVGESRFEVGTAAGVSLSAISGVTLVGITGQQKVFPHLGVEPFSGVAQFNTESRQRDFYEWLPMASAGIQAALGSCRVLPVIKAGAGAGNLEKGGFWPTFSWAHGFGAFFNCSRLDIAANVSRINAGGGDMDLAMVDVAWKIGAQWQLGFRAEGLGFKAPNSESSLFRLSEGALGVERRVMIAIRGNPLGR